MKQPFPDHHDPKEQFHLAFQEIVPTHRNRGNRSGFHARYKVLKNGVGLVLLTSAGIEHLTHMGRNATAGDRIRAFHAPGTGRIALRWEADGPFKLRTTGKRTKALASRTLAKMLNQAATFPMEPGEGFEVVLVPQA